MSRPNWKTLVTSASILSATLVLTPSSAFACCHGFGIGFGIGALTGMAIASQPQPAPAPVYVERRPVPVTSAPVVRTTKTADADKHSDKSDKSEKRHHKETHVADKEPVTRTMKHEREHEPRQAPVATNTKPANDPKDADLRKCLVKEYLPDNSVVFKDTCTQEQASTFKPASVTNEPRKMTQSIQLEPPAVAQDEVPQPQQMDGP